MKTEDMHMNVGTGVNRLMEEARRRFESFSVRYGKTLEQSWLGLGMPSEYGPAVEAGYMTPLNDRSRPRTLCWYLLTKEGLELYRRMFPGSEEGTVRKYRDGLMVDAYAIGSNADEACVDETPCGQERAS